MKLEFQEITIKNFLSFGNVPQTIKLNDKQYQVVIGQNKDKSDSDNDRNGVGKSSIAESIHYALFGQSIGNKTKLGTLVNNINKKNMVVSLKFKRDDVQYEITRGRLPNILKLIKNNVEVMSDESQGDSRETQKEIESILGMNEDVYNQIICLTCKVPTFLEQATANQKMIIEKILGIDLISKKIDSLKLLIKETKNDFNNESFRIGTLKSQNENLQNSINQSETNLALMRDKWKQDVNNQIQEIFNKINILKEIDFDAELHNIELYNDYLAQKENNDKNKKLKESIDNTINRSQLNIDRYQHRMMELQSIDFQSEKEKFAYNESLQPAMLQYAQEENHINELKKNKEQNLEYNFMRIGNEIKKKESELANIKEDVCPTCGQPMKVEEVNKIKASKQMEIDELRKEYHKIDLEILEVIHIIDSFQPKTFELKTTKYNSMYDLIRDENELKTLSDQIQNEMNIISQNQEMLKSINFVELGEMPKCKYINIETLMQDKALLSSLQEKLNELVESKTHNHFEQQEMMIDEMKKNIHIIDESRLYQLQDEMLSQDMLLKLLNNPSSFIRKAILDKSLLYLNERISKYLSLLGSTLMVKFNNDMTIDITSMGLEYGYVSSGEMGRISSALTLAFRDAWESLNNCHINSFFIDEVIDREGLDTSGVELLVDVLKSIKDKNIMIVTHNELLINQSPNIMKIIKENSFSRIE